MPSSLDDLLCARIQELKQQCTNSYHCHITQDDHVKTLSYKDVSLFEKSLLHCKKKLSQYHKENLSDYFSQTYHINLQKEVMDLSYDTIMETITSYFAAQKITIYHEENCLQTLLDNRSLVASVKLTIQERIKQLNRYKWLLNKKQKSRLQHYHQELHELQKVSEQLHESYLQLHQQMSQPIIEHFCFLYQYFASLIYLFEKKCTTTSFIEVAAAIDYFKKILKAPIENDTLQRQELRNNYALAEFTAIQEHILSQI